jgi:hypothetical protein
LWKVLLGVLVAVAVSGAASEAPAATAFEDARSRPLPDLVPGTGLILPSPPTAEWTVYRTTSKADHSKNVQLQLAAVAPIKGWLSEATPTLVVRCEEHKSEVFIVTGMVANPEPDHDGEATVVLRFDEGPAAQYLAGESTDQKALFLRNARDLARTMARHRRMLFRFAPFFSPPQETAFDLTALEQSLPEVEATCAAR